MVVRDPQHGKDERGFFKQKGVPGCHKGGQGQTVHGWRVDETLSTGGWEGTEVSDEDAAPNFLNIIMIKVGPG